MELSIKEKLFKAQRLGFEVTKLENIPEAVEDLAWAHTEGYRIQRMENHIQGRCSLAESLKFDMAEEEKRLDEEIELIREVLTEIIH